MTARLRLCETVTARISAEANARVAGVKAHSVGRRQNPRIIDAKLQGYLS